MAHLFFQSLGNKSYYASGTTDEQAGWGLTDTGDFQNLQSDVYWSGTEYAPDSGYEWSFVADYGVQGIVGKYDSWYAL